MKFLKIRLGHNNDRERTIKYPVGYHNLFFKEAGYVWNTEPDNIDYVICALDEIENESTLTKFLELKEVEELTKEQARAFINQHIPIVETVTNDAVAKRLTIKASLGQEFTAKELKALDPEDPEPGFGKSENLANKLERL